MSRTENIESPCAPGQEFGAEVEEVVQFADGITVPRSMYGRTRCVNWCGEPQFAEEARAAAGEGSVTYRLPSSPPGKRPKLIDIPYAIRPSGELGFVPEPVEPVSDEELEKAVDAVNTALDRLMRSRAEG